MIVEAADEEFFAGQSDALTTVLRPLLTAGVTESAPIPQLIARVSTAVP